MWNYQLPCGADSLKIMRRPRRFAALAAFLTLLQFIVLGSGVACAMPGISGGDASSMASMSMDMGPGKTPMPTTPQAPAHDQAPCRLPWAPANCYGMAPCAPAALTSVAARLLPPPVVPSDKAQLIVLAPPSIAAPPELPPPRA
jgi:hypothetical protein